MPSPNEAADRKAMAAAYRFWITSTLTAIVGIDEDIRRMNDTIERHVDRQRQQRLAALLDDLPVDRRIIPRIHQNRMNIETLLREMQHNLNELHENGEHIRALTTEALGFLENRK